MIRVKGFGDESADGSGQLVFAVAVVFGTEDEWALAVREWLRRTRGRPFHANKCESEFVRDADRQKHRGAQDLYKDLTQIVVRSHLAGFAVALNLKAYHDVFFEMATDWAYYKALADVIGAAAHSARRFNNNEHEDRICLEFTMDSRLESNGTAGTMYSTLANQPEWANADILDTRIVFEGGPGKSPRLEVADLLAREAMKELERKITNERRKVRGARRALEDCQKFVFIERDRAYWDELKAMCEQPESDDLMKQWDEWLVQADKVQKGRPARNLANWFSFNAWLDTRSSGAVRDQRS